MAFKLNFNGFNLLQKKYKSNSCLKTRTRSIKIKTRSPNKSSPPELQLELLLFNESL